MLAAGEIHVGLVLAGPGPHGRDFVVPDVTLVDLELHAHDVRPGLLAERADAHHVAAGAREADHRGDAAPRVHRPHAAVQAEAPAPAQVRGFDPRGARAARVPDDDRLVRDRFRRVEVLLEQDVRHRQDVADVVEAVADAVRGEDLARGVLDADEVEHGVLVLEPVQATESDPAGIDGPRLARTEERVDPGDDARGLHRVRARHLHGRHLAVAQHVGDGGPRLRVLAHRRLVLEGSER